MTAALAGMILPGLSAVPRRLCPVHRHSLEARWSAWKRWTRWWRT
jgi:hypothetical protein